MTCQQRLREEGKPYPRTCEECGLGPCKYGRGQNRPPEPETTPISRPAYQQRVIEEKADLDGKLARLEAFMAGESYRALTPREQHLLHQQAWAMRSYQAALRDRIEMWG